MSPAKPHQDDSASPPPDPSAWRAHRSRHRSQQDSAAHTGGGPFVPPDIADHPMVPAEEPQLITGQAGLEQLVDEFRAVGRFGFDTEFIGENSYVPRLCLIQAATDDRLVLIDPFTIDDLTPWWELLADPAVEKIVHAGEQDLEPVARILQRDAANVFDTQIAAGFVGLDYPMSLVRLVDELVGDNLDAGAKFSQWDRRPLTPRQLHYAASDVRYLTAMRIELGKRLDALGNAAWARQACDEYCDAKRYTPDPLSRKIKSKGINKLSRQKRSVLNAVLLWREGVAKQMDLPPRALVPDEAAHAIAEALPASAAELAGLRFLPRPAKEQFGQDILRCVAQGLEGPYPKPPRRAQYDRDEHRDAVQILWARVANHCAAASINPAVITSKRELGPLVAAAMEDRTPPRLAVNTGWRRELLGAIVADDALLPIDGDSVEAE